MPLNTYPITAVLGDRGSGKTLFMTALAHQYALEGFEIFCNYHLIDIPYTHMTFEALSELPEYLYEAVVFLDEIQVGADSYEIFKESNKAITTFATQLRKRRITLYYSTQVFTMATKRLRQQTNFIIECYPTDVLGKIELRVFDRGLPYDISHIKTLYLNGEGYFNFYDTEEVVTFGDLPEVIEF